MAKKSNGTTSRLRSDQPTIELVRMAREGDGKAMNALLERCLPPLRRFAHGRLRGAARNLLDTGDLVQEAVMNALLHLDTFEPRRVGALQAYLRTAVINKIRDEVRRVRRRPAMAELGDEIPSTNVSALEIAIRKQRTDHYNLALKRLRAKDRELVVARMESQWTHEEVARFFGFPTTPAARMAVTRALKALVKELETIIRPPKTV